ncbi:hypothetical protein Tco_0163954 [Tanacetum coccineum]
MRNRASKAGFKAPRLGQTKGVDEADLTDFYYKIENGLERDEGSSARATSAPTPRLGKRLDAPPSVAIVSASRPSLVGTSVHASTSGHRLSLRGAAVSGHAGKSRAEVVRHQIDPLDSLAYSSLARDLEYDQIPKDNFGTATHGEEIDLIYFLLLLVPIRCLIHMKDSDICRKALDRTITPVELKRIEPLLPLDLSNRFNFLSNMLVSHGAELKYRYTSLVTARNRLQEKFDRKTGYVKVLRSEVMTLDGKLERMQKDCDALTRRIGSPCCEGFAEQLVLEKAKSQGYKDAVDGLREEVTRFVGSGMESLVRCLKVSNFHIGAKVDFDKALVDFPTTSFPFLGKIAATSEGTLFEVTQVLPDKHIRSVTSVRIAPPIANEDADQVPLEHASDDLATSN